MHPSRTTVKSQGNSFNIEWGHRYKTPKTAQRSKHSFSGSEYKVNMAATLDLSNKCRKGKKNNKPLHKKVMLIKGLEEF